MKQTNRRPGSDPQLPEEPALSAGSNPEPESGPNRERPAKGRAPAAHALRALWQVQEESRFARPSEKASAAGVSASAERQPAASADPAGLSEPRSVRESLWRGLKGGFALPAEPQTALDGGAEDTRQLERELKKLAEEQHLVSDGIKLDNAALIFPASESADMMNMFRITALLKEDVQPLVLQKALNLLVPRVPSMTSAVKRGLFWFYLEPSNKPLLIHQQREFPCRKIPLDSRHALVRVTYYGREISAEFFHAATDGNGGITFLNSLLYAYFRLLGYPVECGINCLNYLDRPRPEELVDSYHQFADGVTRKSMKEIRAYHMSGKRLPPTMLLYTKGIMSGRELNAIAKSRELTVTELCTACLLYAVERDRAFFLRKGNRPSIVAVPVNLRKYYQTQTLRNFVALMPVENRGLTDFDELCGVVREQLREQNTREFFEGYVNFNIGAQKNPFVKFLPLPLKVLAMKVALNMFSNNVTTTTFSNLGQAPVPESFGEHLCRYEFTLGPQKKALTTLTAVTFNDNAVFTFTRVIEECNVERYFFRKLSELGAHVALETNCEL